MSQPPPAKSEWPYALVSVALVIAFVTWVWIVYNHANGCI